MADSDILGTAGRETTTRRRTQAIAATRYPFYTKVDIRVFTIP